MQFLSFEKHGRVGVLKLNRPQALNALSKALFEEIKHFMTTEDLESQDIRLLIITGEGKAFIAGADIKEMQAFDTTGIRAYCELGHEVASLIENAKVVTIAAINGFALGGGLEMALACDLIYASKTAKLGQPEVALGVIPGFGGTQRLTRAVGERRAKELLLSGRYLTAEEALAIGLINKVVEPEKLMEEAMAMAEKILANSFAAVLRAKRVIHEGASLSLEKGLKLEQKNFVACFSTKDQKEGMEAFIEKRRPSFD